MHQVDDLVITLNDFTTRLEEGDAIEITLPVNWTFLVDSECTIVYNTGLDRDGEVQACASHPDYHMMTLTLNHSSTLLKQDGLTTTITCTDVLTPEDAIVADPGIQIRTMSSNWRLLDISNTVLLGPCIRYAIVSENSSR